jgi:hypothetical protein
LFAIEVLRIRYYPFVLNVSRADYGIVDDFQKVVPVLKEKIKGMK